jgi:hypothetical protein
MSPDPPLESEMPFTSGLRTWTYPGWAFGFSVQARFLQVYAFGRTIEWVWKAL